MVRVVVVGAGVIGLSCAVRLAESGFDTHVLARDLPLETTSAVAAALWYPYRAAPREAVTRWSARAYAELVRLAVEAPSSGVRVVPGVELLPALDSGTAPEAPWWRAAVADLVRVSDPAPGRRWGWRLDLPVVDMSIYLPWLVATLEAAGGTLTRAWLPELPNAGLVVNCSGLAARSLAGDHGLYPVRGQVLRVGPVEVHEWLLDQGEPARPLYVVPRVNDVIVGGTAEEGDWSTTPDPAIAADLLSRAAALVPALRSAPVLGHRVGLRPARAQVRLEACPHPDGASGAVVHCYGHGGAGVTLSWGCADDVVAMVEELGKAA